VYIRTLKEGCLRGDTDFNKIEKSYRDKIRSENYDRMSLVFFAKFSMQLAKIKEKEANIITCKRCKPPRYWYL
jgi:hypothetical protein